MAVLTVGVIAGLLNVVVLSLTLLRVYASKGDTGNASFSLDAPMAIAVLVAVALTALMVSALMLLAASLARSFRDASHLLTPVLLVAMLPCVLVLLPGVDLTLGWSMVPLANTALLIKSVFFGNATLAAFGSVVASSLFATAVLLMFAARIFADERVMFSTEGKRADFAQVVFAAPTPSLSTALALGALISSVTTTGSPAARTGTIGPCPHHRPNDAAFFSSSVARPLDAALDCSARAVASEETERLGTR